MRVEVLSDHPGAVVRETEREIEGQHQRVAEHQYAVEALRSRHAASRRWWQFGTRLRQYRELRELRGRAPVVDGSAGHRLAQQRAGVGAEDQVTAALQVLSDEWLLFRGYANRRGEVDHLLVGPGGVWAVEVKGHGVCVDVDGDQWRFRKYDRYGNLVERGVLADRRGRSWGRQVCEIGDALREFLESRGVRVVVHTAVVVMNDRASVGSFRNASVSAVSVGVGHLLGRVRAEPGVLDADIRQRIAALVRRDHKFHAERRRSRDHRQR